ncbi:NERD domain-containing protein [Solibacillus sp. CAU 1738]|uniref:NERD domain-containing protein n=1 Tax=Solibacillus sp. CAU 1738 TaxID=3140363 RepID=UPI00326062AF
MTYKKRSFMERVAFALTDYEKQTSPIIAKAAFDDLQKLNQIEQQITTTENLMPLKQLEKQKRIIELGIHGEKSVLFELQNSFLPIHIIHDLRIVHKDLSAQLDFVVITRRFILVIEVKNYYGDIEITEKDEFVRKVRQRNRIVFKEGFYSPIRQVQRQVHVLEMLLKDKEVINKMPIKYVVVFSNKRTLIDANNASIEVNEKILRADQLVRYLTNELKKNSPIHLLDKHMEEMSTYISSQHQSKAINDLDINEEKLLEETILLHNEEDNIVKSEFPTPMETMKNSKQLQEKLIQFRKEQAARQNVKAFYIFSNKTLDELIIQMPVTLEELKNIHGIGKVKIQEFGDELIEIIKLYH